MPVWLKYLITAALVVAISEIAKRSDRAGALIAALPWVTTLAMIWMFAEKQGEEKIGNHAWYTFWYVLPTLPMFLLIPWMLKAGAGFPLTLLASIALTGSLLALTAWLVGKWGIELF